MSDPLGAFLQGLVGDDETPGFRGGYGFRTAIQDRKRRLATEAEAATYERARRLREDVGFQLQQQVGRGQLAAQERTTQTETDRRARVTAAAQQIRQQYGADPRYKGITLLPDEDLVREFGDLTTNPQRLNKPGGTGVGAGGVDERAVIGLANRLFDPDGHGDASGGYATWDDAYSEALKRYQTAGRLSGRPAPSSASTHAPLDPMVRDYIARYNRGPTASAPAGREVSKSPAEWVTEVRREHPDWTPEQVAAEARRRAGAR